MPPLEAAFALAQMQQGAVPVAQHLHFNVPGPLDEFLDVDLGVAEGILCFRLRIAQGELDFSDESLTPGFAARIYELAGTVNGLSSDHATRSQFELEGRVNEFGAARLTGAINPFVPREQVEVLDTWHTRGMRGTGTNHFELKDVFVPEAHTVYTTKPPRITDGKRFHIPQTLVFAAGDGIVALAVARNCINDFCELAGSKAPHRMVGLLRDQPIAQYNVGECEAQLNSAHAYLMDSVDKIWDDVMRTGDPSMESRVAVRLSGTHAIRVAAKIVESIYADCGATAIFEGNAIQRYFQDVHVITQHMQGRRVHYEMIGKYRLGLPIDEGRM